MLYRLSWSLLCRVGTEVDICGWVANFVPQVRPACRTSSYLLHRVVDITWCEWLFLILIFWVVLNNGFLIGWGSNSDYQVWFSILIFNLDLCLFLLVFFVSLKSTYLFSELIISIYIRGCPLRPAIVMNFLCMMKINLICICCDSPSVAVSFALSCVTSLSFPLFLIGNSLIFHLFPSKPTASYGIRPEQNPQQFCFCIQGKREILTCGCRWDGVQVLVSVLLFICLMIFLVFWFGSSLWFCDWLWSTIPIAWCVVVCHVNVVFPRSIPKWDDSWPRQFF